MLLVLLAVLLPRPCAAPATDAYHPTTAPTHSLTSPSLRYLAVKAKKQHPALGALFFVEFVFIVDTLVTVLLGAQAGTHRSTAWAVASTIMGFIQVLVTVAIAARIAEPTSRSRYNLHLVSGIIGLSTYTLLVKQFLDEEEATSSEQDQSEGFSSVQLVRVVSAAPTLLARQPRHPPLTAPRPSACT